MYLLYIFVLLYLGWRLCAPLCSLLDDGTDARRSAIATVLCFVPMAWCVGYTAAVTAAWVLVQSANLVGGWRPEVSVAAWGTVAALLLGSRCIGRASDVDRAGTLGRVPFSCAALVLAIWSVATSLTFGVTTVDAGIISTPQNLVRDLYSHTAIIRSFSMGYNFPTEYPFFHGDAIRYHFLFYFGGGVLESLGAPFSVALNLPSALAFGSLLSLSAFLSWSLTSSFVAASLAITFALFRSSMSWVDWIAALRRSALEGNPIFRESFWYGVTPYEDWGIFSLNVHLNQRHLMHGLALMLIVLVACLLTPPLKGPWRNRASLIYGSLGAVLGCGAYWNGNAFLATMLALIPLSCVSAYRAKAILVGGAAAFSGGLVVLLVTHGAVGRTPFEPALHFGFLSPSSAFLEVARYTLWIFGVLPIVALIAAWRGDVRARSLWWCGFMPIVFIFSSQVTPIAPQGHKFINAGTLIWSILGAGFAASLLVSARSSGRLVGQILVLIMILTGIVDAGALGRLAGTRLSYPVDDEAIRWVERNTSREAIFLSSARGDTAPLLAGRRVLMGPESLTSETGHPYDERVRWLRRVISFEPAQQIVALRDAGVTHIATEVCREMKGLINDPCPALPEVEILVRNPLLTTLYSSPEFTVVGVPRD